MKVQKKTYEGMLLNLHAVEIMFRREKIDYDKHDFKEVSKLVGISTSRIKRAYENLSSFGYINLRMGYISNAIVIPNKPTVRRKPGRRRSANTYIKRKDENYINIAKHILHDRIFTNMQLDEIATKWNCSKSRVGSLVSEVVRYGAIKLPKFKEHILIDTRKYKGVDIKSTVRIIKSKDDVFASLENGLRHKLLVRVLRKELTFNE